MTIKRFDTAKYKYDSLDVLAVIGIVIFFTLVIASLILPF